MAESSRWLGACGDLACDAHVSFSGEAMSVLPPVLSATRPGLASLPAAGYSVERIAQVLSFYDEPHRHYHDRQHVYEMFDAAAEAGLRPSVAQSLAILFHDAIYVPGAARGINESLSAQLLRVYAAGVERSAVDSAYSIILDTIEHVPSSPESVLVQDLDLVRLGVPRPRFEHYSRQLFDEQRPLIGVADDAGAWAFFERLRRAFYGRLLEREQIFHAAPFRARFESQARTNLRTALGLELPAQRSG
jgi:predicted metal-dependent HD superfamily phosphohydrolase